MASETVDPIDWSQPPPSWAVPPERLVHSIIRWSTATAGFRSCNLQHERQPPCLCGHSGYYIKNLRFIKKIRFEKNVGSWTFTKITAVTATSLPQHHCCSVTATPLLQSPLHHCCSQRKHHCCIAVIATSLQSLPHHCSHCHFCSHCHITSVTATSLQSLPHHCSHCYITATSLVTAVTAT